MAFINENDVTAVIKQKYKTKEYVALCSDGSFTKNGSLSELVKKLIDKGFRWSETPRKGYISIIDVIRSWDQKPMCVEYPSGADAMLQDNGYTLDDAIEFALNGCTFFYD